MKHSTKSKSSSLASRRRTTIALVLCTGLTLALLPPSAGAVPLSQVSTTTGTLTETLDGCTRSVPATATAIYSGGTFVSVVVRGIDGSLVVVSQLTGAFFTTPTLCGSLGGPNQPPIVSPTCSGTFALTLQAIGGGLTYSGSSGRCESDMDVTLGSATNPTPLYAATAVSQWLCVGTVTVTFTTGTSLILPAHFIGSSCAAPNLCATWITLPYVRSCQLNPLGGVTQVPWATTGPGAPVACRWTQRVSLDIDADGFAEAAQEVYTVTSGPCP